MQPSSMAHTHPCHQPYVLQSPCNQSCTDNNFLFRQKEILLAWFLPFVKVLFLCALGLQLPWYAPFFDAVDEKYGLLLLSRRTERKDDRTTVPTMITTLLPLNQMKRCTQTTAMFTTFHFRACFHLWKRLILLRRCRHLVLPKNVNYQKSALSIHPPQKKKTFL